MKEILVFMMKLSMILPLIIIFISYLISSCILYYFNLNIDLSIIYPILLTIFIFLGAFIFYILIKIIVKKTNTPYNSNVQKFTKQNDSLFFELYTFLNISFSFLEENQNKVGIKYIIWFALIIILFFMLSNEYNAFFLKIIGYKLYSVVTVDNIEYTLITRRKSIYSYQDNCQIKVIKITENLFIEINT